jgi:hypothetical protein
MSTYLPIYKETTKRRFLMKKRSSNPMSEFKKEFTKFFKKWAVENKLETSAICSVAIYESVPVPEEIADNCDDGWKQLHVSTTEIATGKKLPIGSHAQTLIRSLKEDYDDGSLDG